MEELLQEEILEQDELKIKPAVSGLRGINFKLIIGICLAAMIISIAISWIYYNSMKQNDFRKRREELREYASVFIRELDNIYHDLNYEQSLKVLVEKSRKIIGIYDKKLDSVYLSTAYANSAISSLSSEALQKIKKEGMLSFQNRHLLIVNRFEFYKPSNPELDQDSYIVLSFREHSQFMERVLRLFLGVNLWIAFISLITSFFLSVALAKPSNQLISNLKYYILHKKTGELENIYPVPLGEIVDQINSLMHAFREKLEGKADMRSNREKEIHSLLEFYQARFSVPSFVISPENLVVAASPQVLELYKSSPEDILNKHFFSLLTIKKHKEMVMKHLDPSNPNKEIVELEFSKKETHLLESFILSTISGNYTIVFLKPHNSKL